MTEIPTEPDHIAGRLVAATIIVATIAIAASCLVVWLLASRLAHGGGRGDVSPAALEPPADPFALATEHERHRLEQQHALDSWQWADAEHTRVRMPIELAIDRYLAGAK
jgi:hypothetical protein